MNDARLRTTQSKESALKRFAVRAAIAVVIGLALLAILALLNRRDQVVGLNQEIQYDDFAFSVLGTRQIAALGEGESRQRAQGVYTIVTMKVANHARRVDYTFHKQAAILMDDNGNEFHLSPEGQKAFDATRAKSDPCAGPMPAGESCTTEIVFDIPAGAHISHLRISEGGAVGDVLDAIFYGRKRIAMPPGE